MRPIGAPRRSTCPSVQDRVMESRFAHGHWEARLCVVL